MPNNAKNKVHKEKEFRAYILWSSLPPIFKNKPLSVLEKYGITDPLAIELLAIPNQKEFARKFGIRDLGTLTDWNRKIREGNLLKKSYGWAQNLTKNVYGVFYEKLMREGTADQVRLWFEIFGDIEPNVKKYKTEREKKSLENELRSWKGRCLWLEEEVQRLKDKLKARIN